MLETLQKQGKKLAIASSKPTVFVKQILQHFGIALYFTVVVGSELDGTRDKKEEVVEEALRQLIALDKEKYVQTVMVGDRKYDVQGANAFGIDCIAVTYGYGSREELEAEKAAIIVNTVEELTHILTESDLNNE